MHDALGRWAADEFRSLNAQIEMLLRNALNDAGRMPGKRRRCPDVAGPQPAAADGAMALPRAYGRSADTHRAARPPTRPMTRSWLTAAAARWLSLYQATHAAGAVFDFFTV